MLHQETLGSIDHSSKHGIIEHSSSNDYLVPHNVNVERCQINYFEDDIIDVFGEFLTDEDSFTCEDDDA